MNQTEIDTEQKEYKPFLPHNKWVRFTILSLFIGLVLGMILPVITRPKVVPYRLVCGTNLNLLAKAILSYAAEYEGAYPDAQKWCDLLITFTSVPEKQFRCFGNKFARSAYAMNPNCEPNSPPDVVLLFDAKGGWNQYGGPELLTYDNHGGKGANVLFNDGHVEFVKPEDISKLRWQPKKTEP